MAEVNKGNKKPWAQRMLFISGRISLDLAHTGGEGRYKVFERLHSPADLAAWFAESPLRLRGVEATQEDLTTAYRLREAIWHTAHAVRVGSVPEAAHINLINAAAASPTLIPRLATDGARSHWQSPVQAKAALSAVARDAIDLFSHQDEIKIHRCANPSCQLLFVDSSRPGKRRWCSMERCGNMAKTKQYRRKEREKGEASD